MLHNRFGFESWLGKMQNSTAPLFSAIADRNTDMAVWRQTLMRIDTTHGVIKTGCIHHVSTHEWRVMKAHLTPPFNEINYSFDFKKFLIFSSTSPMAFSTGLKGVPSKYFAVVPSPSGLP